jgi:hypothetical protein
LLRVELLAICDTIALAEHECGGSAKEASYADERRHRHIGMPISLEEAFGPNQTQEIEVDDGKPWRMKSKAK